MPTDFRTRNLFEAAFLSTVVSVPEIEKDNEGICWFVFPLKAEEESKSYWNGKAKVNAKELANNVRNLKDRMQSIK